jgi:hypothetical protein
MGPAADVYQQAGQPEIDQGGGYCVHYEWQADVKRVGCQTRARAAAVSCKGQGEMLQPRRASR